MTEGSKRDCRTSSRRCKALARSWRAFGVPTPITLRMSRARLQPIRATTEKVTLLDVGCGTGLELKYVFQKAPQAQITGIDLADGMLERLEGKFRNRMDQITLIRGNCLDVEFGEGVFDYAISTLALHHLPPPNRKVVYDKILQSLKPDGCFVEGDGVTPV